MSDRRRKDQNWLLNVNTDGTVPTSDAQLAVLMDIREELKLMNLRLQCSEFISIPKKLDRIARNTAKPKRK